MGNERARQKKLAKRKKNRAIAQKNARGPDLPTSIASLERAAMKWPIASAFIAGDLRDEGIASLLSALLVRDMPDGRVHVSVALVDRTCLGVKDGYSMRALEKSELKQMLDSLKTVHQGLEEVTPEFLRSVVFHAIDYAAALGFSPHPDFPAALFGPRPEVLLETPWCRAPKPIYISGPDDDVRAITAKLAARVGPDGYELVAGGGRSYDDRYDAELDDEEGDEEVDDEGEDGENAEAARMMDYIAPLLGADPSPERLEMALQLGGWFGSIALDGADAAARAIEKRATVHPEESERERFRQLARAMIVRHREKFPELHLKK